MKGIVRWPFWSAPAASSATRPKPLARTTEPPEERVDPSNRITLAVLEERFSSPESAKGYDPYNAAASRRPVDVWRRKPKRD